MAGEAQGENTLWNQSANSAENISFHIICGWKATNGITRYFRKAGDQRRDLKRCRLIPA